MTAILVLYSILLISGEVYGHDDAWLEFKMRYSKKYGLAEENERRKIFENNLLEIAHHNKKYNEGLVPYKLGINIFADLKPMEAIHRDLANKTLSKGPNRSKDPIDYSSNVPEFIDWRTEGAVTDVGLQGNDCTSWAFSTTGAIEGQLAIQYGVLQSLSVQQLVDCMQFYSKSIHAVVEDAFQYVQNNGLMTSQDYPYTGIEGDCKAHSADKTSRIYLQGFEVVRNNSEEALKSAVASIGPISVSLKMDRIKFYESGIFTGNCTGILNHHVLVVGYGKDNFTGTEYWIIKNCWGPKWGENGYFRMQMGLNCGITDHAHYPKTITNINKLLNIYTLKFNINLVLVCLAITVFVFKTRTKRKKTIQQEQQIQERKKTE